jgi:hypothetical protein
LAEPVLPFVIQPPGDAAVVDAVASRVADIWSLPPPVPLRMGMNALYAAGDEVVLRVGRTTSDPADALWLAEFLTARGIAVPTYVRPQPITIDGLTTFAIRREHVTAPIDWQQVGRMCAQLHQIDSAEVEGRYPTPWCSSFPWWQFDSLLADVGPSLDAGSRTGIEATLDRYARWRDHVDRVVLCHGDVHPGNVLQTDAGPVLIDWDLMCVGPAAWDHAPMMTWTERWGGLPGVYEQFASGYGESLRGDPVAEALADLRLVAATLMRVRAGRADAAAADEAEQRLRWWRGDPDAPPWRTA